VANRSKSNIDILGILENLQEDFKKPRGVQARVIWLEWQDACQSEGRHVAKLCDVWEMVRWRAGFEGSGH